MRVRKGKIILLISLFLIMGWAVSPAPALAAEKFVNFLFSGPLTGPGASTALPAYQGLTNYFDEMNNRGGVDGVKIKVIEVDDRYDVSRAISFYMRQRKAPRVISMLVAGTATSYGVLPLITRDKLPTFGTCGTCTLKLGYYFQFFPSYQDQFGAALDWIVEDWKEKGNTGMPTVAFLGWVTGQEAYNGPDKYAKEKGINLLPAELFPPGTLKYDTYLTRLDNAGAKYIYILGVDPDPSFILRDAYNLGLTKKIQFISMLYGFLDDVGGKLLPPEVFEGAIAGSPWLLGDEQRTHPFSKLFTKYNKKPVSEMSGGYLIGVTNAIVVEKALGMALKKVGYEKINGEAVYQSLQEIQGDRSQGAMGPITLGPKSRNLTRAVKYYRWTKGKLVPMGGWRETPDCFSLGEYK